MNYRQEPEKKKNESAENMGGHCFDGDEFLFDGEENRNVIALLGEIEIALNEIELPPPPSALVDDVMAFIAKREAQRSLVWLIPGFGALASVIKTAARYLSALTVPNVLRREALAVSIAAFVIVWSVFISPQVEAGKIDPYVAKANQAADYLLLKGEIIADRLSSIANEWTPKPFRLEKATKNEEKATEKESNARTLYKNAAYETFSA
ncbi:MAG: hypothetical protein AB1656_14750 [Candidatus Omnitrophota bacterium]